MDNKRTEIIIISLIVLISIICIVFSILYFATDIFKSSEILFQKYISQNLKNVVDVVDISEEENIMSYLKSNDYIETTEANLKYLESENDEEEVYNINQKAVVNNSKGESFKDSNLKYGDETLARLQIIKQDNKYGFRLANLVKQFVSVENESISYLVSSLGINAESLPEKFNQIDIKGIFNFSEEEIETLTKTYTDVIFSDINPKSYSTQKNATITLSNGEILDNATAYSLTITKNDLDKIYKRILNQAINDQIILSKFDALDAKIKEAGFNEQEGNSIKEIYTSTLQSILNSIEYKGEDTRQIVFTVYQTNAITVRTSIKTEEVEITLDVYNNAEGKTAVLKIEKLLEDRTETKIYTIANLNSATEHARTIGYSDDTQNIQTKISFVKQDNGMAINTLIDYTSDKIANIKFEHNKNIEISSNYQIPVKLDESNNILLNNYEGDQIISILESLEKAMVQKLNESQSKINTKLLNNILIWIDNKDKEREDKEKNDIENQKQRFNNQFILYEGENLSYEHVQKLIKLLSNNMSDYEVVSGNKVKIYVKDGIKNEEKAKEIGSVIVEDYTYNVKIYYSEDGYVNAIDISVYEEDNN